MPTYEYRCDCGHSHEEFRPITEPHPEKCPACGLHYGVGFEQAWMKSRQVGIVKGNPTTVGQQAEINMRRMGKEQLELYEQGEILKRQGFSGKLPDGATLVKETIKPKTPWWRTGEVKGLKKMDKPLDITKVKNRKKFVETGVVS